MTEKIKFITVIDLLFLFLLGASGSIQSGILSDAVYYLAFIIPIVMGFGYIFKKRELEESSTAVTLNDFTIKKDGALLALPIVIPQIFTVLLISVATTALMGLLGETNEMSFDEPFGYAILIHALIPAVLEELLFRFVPIKILAGEEKTAIVLSSMMFSFAHPNFFQIPYAFIAGIIFASVCVATRSILPTIVMHFLNNLISLMTIYQIGNPWLIPVLSVLLIISVAVIIIHRKAYIAALKSLTCGNRITIGSPPLCFALLSITLAISVFFV